MKKISSFIIIFLILTSSLVILVSCTFIYWLVRPNTCYKNSDLDYEISEVNSDAIHNAFTDMIYFKGYFYLTFRSASKHVPTDDSIVKILKSKDAKDWENVKEFKMDGKDIRDPKFGIIKGKLFIYLIIREITSETKGEIATTYYSYSEDGKSWCSIKEIEPKGMRFWRPKTFDNKSWFCPIFTSGQVNLYNSSDGINWEKISIIYDEPEADETDFIFKRGGSIIAITRLQKLGIFGDSESRTLISTSKSPYKEWDHKVDSLSRLDGPCLFNISGRIFAVARFQPEEDGLFQNSGSSFSKKRTAIYYIKDDNIIYLSDLPSCGDTSYPGAVVRGQYLYISYYTSDIARDYPWFLGQISSAKVYIAKIKIDSLLNIAEDEYNLYKEGKAKSPTFPLIDYLIFFLIILLCGLYFVKMTKFALKRNERMR
ncbi:MAG: hypothetical protein ACTSRP_24625 [Candidatus Helarchaeota archaeon]